MTNSITNPRVDFYFAKAKKWQTELERLREIVLACGLTEELKWSCPCYMLEKSNIVLIHAFKDYAALLFFKGVLLDDPENILIQQTEHVQAGRQIRFTSVEEISEMEAVIKAYIEQAIEVEKSGRAVTFKKTAEFNIPTEFQQKLDVDEALNVAFHALTPGRQRAYLLHFSSAKQAKTREARIEKCMERILEGKGLDDA